MLCPVVASNKLLVLVQDKMVALFLDLSSPLYVCSVRMLRSIFSILSFIDIKEILFYSRYGDGQPPY